MSSSNSSQYTNPGLDNDPLYLATLNASNIQFLKNQMGDYSNLQKTVSDLSGEISVNSSQISKLTQQVLSNSGVPSTPEDATAAIPTNL